MDDILHIDRVSQYNDLMGVATLHPLVSVIDFATCAPCRHVRLGMGCYTLFLKEVQCGELLYGRSRYDYQEGTLVFLAPGQVIGIADNGQTFQPKGWALLFDPELLHGTELGRRIKEYGFFSYEVNEALHLSESERRTVIDCLRNIQAELHHSPDRHSRSLIVSNIELLLNYCMRFYERQFAMRHPVNSDLLARFERLLDDYYRGDLPQRLGLPTVRYFAEQLHLSPNYFGDLIRKETGRTAQEQIQLHLIDRAKELICDTERSVSDIAYELGFQYPQHFSRLFKKVVGQTPVEYRTHE